MSENLTLDAETQVNRLTAIQSIVTRNAEKATATQARITLLAQRKAEAEAALVAARENPAITVEALKQAEDAALAAIKDYNTAVTQAHSLRVPVALGLMLQGIDEWRRSVEEAILSTQRGPEELLAAHQARVAEAKATYVKASQDLLTMDDTDSDAWNKAEAEANVLRATWTKLRDTKPEQLRASITVPGMPDALKQALGQATNKPASGGNGSPKTRKPRTDGDGTTRTISPFGAGGWANYSPMGRAVYNAREYARKHDGAAHPTLGSVITDAEGRTVVSNGVEAIPQSNYIYHVIDADGNRTGETVIATDPFRVPLPEIAQ